MRVPRFLGRILAVVGVIFVFAVPRCSGAQLVDEVVASVGRSAILQSDLALARIVRLVPVSGLSPVEARRAVFDGRLRLEIQYRDLEASGIVYRLKIDQKAVVRELMTRAGGAEALASALKAAGLGMEDLRELALRVGAVNAYVNQRLRPRVRVTLQELKKAYQESLVLEIVSRGGTPPSFETVRDQLHTLLVERKLNREIETWIQEARTRLEVTILVPPAAVPDSAMPSPPPHS